jgi:proteasome lid subunit RPN8/RPN11
MADDRRPVGVVRIRRSALAALCRHAAEALPAECCGLLIGQPDEIDEAVPARNLARRPTRFLVHPEDHFAAIRAARARGAAVVGAYHSHPASAPVPSPTDLEASVDPALLHIIVSLQHGVAEVDTRAYRLHAGNFDLVELVPVG